MLRAVIFGRPRKQGREQGMMILERNEKPGDDARDENALEGRVRTPSGAVCLLRRPSPEFLLVRARRVKSDLKELTLVSYEILSQVCMTPSFSLFPAKGQRHPR